MLKNSRNYATDFFVTFLMLCLRKEPFPTKRTESILVPLFKKGDVNNLNNYRGISLCDKQKSLQYNY